MDLRTLGSEPPKPEKQEALVPREITLTIKYTAPDGQTYHEPIRSRVLSGEERLLVERRTALLAGAPWDQLSEYARARITALALVSVQLRDIPDWLNQWLAEDDDLLFTLRGEVERHSSAWFLGALGASGTDASASRVSCASSDAATIDRVLKRPTEADAQ